MHTERSTSPSRAPRRARRARARALVFVALAFAPFAGCRGGPKAPDLPPGSHAVSGRTKTTAGLSFDFPDGWAESPTGGRTFTQYFENKQRQLALGLSEYPNPVQSAAGLGDQMKRRLEMGGAIRESGPVTVDGRDAYRIVAEQKTASGHGIVIGVVVVRNSERASSIFIYSANDERENHRAEMDALLATMKVE